MHPFVSVQLGEQKYETRTVRGSSSPVFNEYFELLCRDPLKERLEIRVSWHAHKPARNANVVLNSRGSFNQVESKDLLMSDKIGYIKIPVVQIARGKVLQVEPVPSTDVGHVFGIGRLGLHGALGLISCRPQ